MLESVMYVHSVHFSTFKFPINTHKNSQYTYNFQSN